MASGHQIQDNYPQRDGTQFFREVASSNATKWSAPYCHSFNLQHANGASQDQLDQTGICVLFPPCASSLLVRAIEYTVMRACYWAGYWVWTGFFLLLLELASY